MSSRRSKQKKRSRSENLSFNEQDPLDSPSVEQSSDATLSIEQSIENATAEQSVDNLAEEVERATRLGDESFVNSAQSDASDGEEEVLGETHPAQIIQYKMLPRERVMIGLSPGAEFFFKGCLQAKVIKGEISTQGHRLGCLAGYTPIYSPRGHSLLSISAIHGSQTEEEVRCALVSENLEESQVLDAPVILLAKKLTEPWIEFLKKSLKKSEKINLFGRDSTSAAKEDSLTELEKCLDITLYRPDTISTKLWRPGQDWSLAVTSLEIVRKSDRQPRLVVTGGKGVGKSSFLRWITNQLLVEGDVLFLDLDPGQREFGLPGYVSLSLLNQPLLGPNFCQPDAKWEKSIYFGDINVSNNPGRYVSCVKKLVRLAREYATTPLVVNTMGWCQGLGLVLNTDIIRLSEPTTVVQLKSRFPKKNYPAALTVEFVRSTKSYWTKVPSCLSYSLLEFAAVPERRCAKDMRSKDSWGIPEPSVLREIQTLSWLGRRGGVLDLPVYSIHFSQVGLSVTHENVRPQGLLAALLLKPVDLVTVGKSKLKRPKLSEDYSILEKSPVVESIGVGFMRGVDSERRLIYVATAIEENLLREVNCLVGGCLSLPVSLLGKEKIPGPYLSSAPDTPLDQPWQRNHAYGKFT